MTYSETAFWKCWHPTMDSFVSCSHALTLLHTCMTVVNSAQCPALILPVPSKQRVLQLRSDLRYATLCNCYLGLSHEPHMSTLQ